MNGIVDPLKLRDLLWPNVYFYAKQKEVIYSVVENDETFVPAGHQLGKDFVSGFLALWYFLVFQPVRVITTSVKDDHLRVLWGEIGQFIQTSKYPLEAKRGGPLIINHRELKKVVDGQTCPVSYCLGTVSEKGEGLAGHHAPNTLLIIDEASGVDDLSYERGATWAKRILVIGNPYECQNFFRRGVREGDLLAAP